MISKSKAVETLDNLKKEILQSILIQSILELKKVQGNLELKSFEFILSSHYEDIVKRIYLSDGLVKLDCTDSEGEGFDLDVDSNMNINDLLEVLEILETFMENYKGINIFLINGCYAIDKSRTDLDFDTLSDCYDYIDNLFAN